MGSSVLLLLLAVLMLVFLTSRGRRQQRRTAELQSSLLPGQRVMTTAGLYAEVVEVGETTVVLQTSPGVHSTWARQAVARTVDDGAGLPVPAEPATVPAEPAAPPHGAAVDLRKDLPASADGDVPQSGEPPAR